MIGFQLWLIVDFLEQEVLEGSAKRNLFFFESYEIWNEEFNSEDPQVFVNVCVLGGKSVYVSIGKSD